MIYTSLCIYYLPKETPGTGDVPPQVKGQAHHQPELEPQVLMKVEGEKQVHKAVCCPPHMCVASTPPQDTSYTLIIIKFKSKANSYLQGYSVSPRLLRRLLRHLEKALCFPQAPARSLFPHISFQIYPATLQLELQNPRTYLLESLQCPHS